MSMRTVLACMFIGLGIIIMVLCRIATIHHTEGEALIDMWQYWATACFSILMGVILAR